MKRFLSIFLLLILAVAALPQPGLAAEPKITLEEAILKVKTVFDTSGYKDFTSSLDTYDKHSQWKLNYDSKPNGLNVSVDGETGDIVSAYQFSEDDIQNNYSHLPSVKYEDAKKTAMEFLKKVAPDKYDCLRLDEEGVDKYNPYGYRFNFIRQVDGIDFPSNSANIRVNATSGIVENYVLNWQDYSFPDSSGILSSDKADEIYAKELGVRLIYRTFDDKIRLVYLPDYIYSIDALSGNTVKAEDMMSMGGMGMGGGANQSVPQEIPKLTPEEEKEISESKDLTSENEAIKVLQGKFPFIKNMTLESSTLGANNNDRYWDISFSRADSKKAEEGEVTYAYFTIDAKTGEIAQLNIKRKDFKDNTKDIGRDKAMRIAADFISQEQPDRFKQAVLDTVNIVQDYSGNYRLHFDRIVNGIAFPENGFDILIEKTDGMVTVYSMVWEEHDFPGQGKIITSNEANSIVLEDIDLKLQYAFKLNEDYAMKFQKEDQQQVLLIYRLDIEYPYGYIYVDASSGELIDRSGKPIDEDSALPDISGSPYKEDIEILYGKGAIAGSDFKPEEEITQKDFLSMLVKAMNMGGRIKEEGLPEGYEDVYMAAIQNRIIDKKEIDPDRILTVNDGIVYTVRSLSLKDIAELGSYDGNGYSLLADGLGIINTHTGGNLTKENAAHIIVNTMKVPITW